MKLSRYCACGEVLNAHVSPGRLADGIAEVWDQTHSEPGCAPATAEQARAARRRRIATAPPANTFDPPF